MSSEHDRDLALALRLADAADEITMRHFRAADLAHELKGDGSPVSAADLAVEERIRQIVADERPGDVVVGEEIGAAASGRRRWIVDGIDGTVLYIAGSDGWGTEIALEVDGEVVVGVASSPSLGRRWWAARGAPAVDTGRPIHVSTQGEIDAASCSAVPPLDVLPAPERMLGETLSARCRYVAPTLHAALLVADGSVDVAFQAFGGEEDVAALSVIVEQAGGRFSDLGGRRRIDGGGPFVFSNGVLHDDVLALYR